MPSDAAPSYFPDDIGWRWEFVAGTNRASIENVGTVTVIGREAIIRRYLVNDLNVLDEYWSTDAQGNVLMHGWHQPGFPRTRTFDPPIVFLSAPLVQGDAWEQTFDVYNDLAGTQYNEQATTVMIVATAGTISLPYGDVFAFGVDDTRVNRVAADECSARAQPTRWFADGIGPVQFLFQAQLFQLEAVTPAVLPVAIGSWGAVKARYGK
jgi:hypothetical protein